MSALCLLFCYRSLLRRCSKPHQPAAGIPLQVLAALRNLYVGTVSRFNSRRIHDAVHTLRSRLGQASGSAGGAGSGNAVWADDAGVGTAGAGEPLLGFLTAR